MTARRTMTLNLTVREMNVLEGLAQKRDMSKTGILRQALRLYQLVDVRLDQGETIVFEDDSGKKRELIVV